MTEREYSAGKTQYALQLVGPGQLSLNSHKEIFQPGPRQILIKVEAVGLCFSDLKLLKQFSAHPRKAEIVSGYRPGGARPVPELRAWGQADRARTRGLLPYRGCRQQT